MGVTIGKQSYSFHKIEVHNDYDSITVVARDNADTVYAVLSKKEAKKLIKGLKKLLKAGG